MSSAVRPDVSIRPWGAFAVIEIGDGYQVKRLEVQPGRRLSYQTHRLRSEHWFVVAGTGRAILDGAAIPIGRGDSLDIGIGTPHRIENTGIDVLVLIEVQCGSYLGEDDIVRLDDDFGRAADERSEAERPLQPASPVVLVAPLTSAGRGENEALITGA